MIDYTLKHGSHDSPQAGLCAMESPCDEWSGYRSASGYGYVRHRGKMRRAHRVEWEKTRGAIPAGMCILHRCDNPACVNVEHLFLGTQLENIADREEKGRGSIPPSRRKLTASEVQTIRDAYSTGRFTQQELADRFPVSRGNLSKVLNDKSYQEVG